MDRDNLSPNNENYNFATDSSQIYKSKNIVESTSVYLSQNVSESVNIIDSKDVSGSYNVLSSSAISDSFGVSNCHGIDNCLFVIGVRGKSNYLFDTPCSLDRVETIKNSLFKAMDEWYPEIINNETFNWETIPNDVLIFLICLPEFNVDIFSEITGLPRHEYLNL